jgi:hypothetical protein
MYSTKQAGKQGKRANALLAYTYDENLIFSEFRCLQIVNRNGKIIDKVELNSVENMTDIVLLNNKKFVSIYNKLKIFE